MIGEKFGSLTVEALIESKSKDYWLCRCECGEYVRAIGFRLRTGRAVCGCQTNLPTKPRPAAVRVQTRKPEYPIWRILRNKKLLCAKWRDDFERFLADVGPQPTPFTRLCRKDTKQLHQPGNSVWGVACGRHKRSRFVVPYRGGEIGLSDFRDMTGIPVEFSRDRMKEGMMTGEEIEREWKRLSLLREHRRQRRARDSG